MADELHRSPARRRHVLHPGPGARLGPWSSFAYSAFASAAYEFGVESFFERPSIQDLIVTPIGGALLGYFVFEPVRAWIKAKPERAWYDQVGLFLTDPLGGLNGVFERLFGIKSDVQVGLKPPIAVQRDRPCVNRALVSRSAWPGSPPPGLLEPVDLPGLQR